MSVADGGAASAEILKGTLQAQFAGPAAGLEGAGVVLAVDGLAHTTLQVGSNEHLNSMLRREEGGVYTLRWFIPSRYYDGQPHAFQVLDPSNDDHVLASTDEVTLSLKKRPILNTGFEVDSLGRLAGYAWEHKRPNANLALEVWVSGAKIGTHLAGLPTPAFAPIGTPPVCGFCIPLSGVTPWLEGRASLVVADLDERLTVDPAILLKPLSVETALADGAVRAQVRRPRGYGDLRLELLLDGKPTPTRKLSRLAEVVELSAPAPRDAEAMTAAVRIAGFEAPISPPSPLGATGSVGGNRLANAGFAHWEGATPVAWDVLVEDPVSVRLAWPPGDDDRFAPALRLQSPAGLPLTPILRQSLTDAVGAEGVEVRLKAQADEACVVHLGLAAADGAALGSIAISLDERLTQASAVIVAEPPTEAASLVLSVESAGRLRLDLHSVTAGPPGFGEDRTFSGLGASVTEELLVNAGFRNWPNGFDFALGPKRVVTAENWLASASSPGATLSLCQLATPGLSVPAYGAALRGDLAKPGRTVLSAELNAAVLAARPLAGLSLILGRNPTMAGRIERPSRLARLAIVIEGEDDKPQPVAILAQNLHLDADPRPVRFALTPAQRRLVEDAAQSAGSGERLFLAIEFQDKILDAVIGQPTFTFGADDKRATLTGYAAFEDYWVRSQLAHVDGLDLWRSPTPVRQAVAAPSTAVAAEPGEPTAPWIWSSGAPWVDVVVPVFNAEEETLACLESVVTRTTTPHRLIVVDDSSSPRVQLRLAEFAAKRPWVTLITNPENLGYTRSSNIGLRAATADWVLLLNSDTVVTTDWLVNMLACATANPDIALVGPVSNAATWQSVPEVRNRTGAWSANQETGLSPEAFADLVRQVSTNSFPLVPLLNGFCTLMRRSVIEEVGLLDEKAFPVGYGEENDLCLRVSKAGYKLAVADNTFVYHHKSASFGSLSRKTLAKEGAATCRARHPEVDFEALQRELGECLPLVELRARVRQALAARGADQ